MRISFLIWSIIVTFLLSVACNRQNADIYQTSIEGPNWNAEVIYHVMPRSFFDSNGDLQGDLRGMSEKLDYLEELGVTTILFTPLYESEFYHNYFPTDYYAIDPEYGTMEDYLAFVRAVHDRDMKFIMDMETQYVQSGHPWFDDSYKNPDSEFSDFVYYSDSLNEYPAQIFFDTMSPLFEFKAWPLKETHNIATLDLRNRRMRLWQKQFYAYWVDPNQDGQFDDGVDGFRIDHIMDDLDNKGIFTNLYKELWQPIFDTCRFINPNLFVVGEQANWGDYGNVMIRQSGADAAFNFKLHFALTGKSTAHDMYDPDEEFHYQVAADSIHQVVRNCLTRFDSSSYFVNFLENHDTDRWATAAGENAGLMKMAATVYMLMPGIPSLYYGQELGMSGRVGQWDSDVNHIPVREAFPWHANSDMTGIAAFYKDTGPWWDASFYNSDRLELLSLASQQSDPTSMWTHYMKVIRLRKSNKAFISGDYVPIRDAGKQILAFRRTSGRNSYAVVANLSDRPVVLRGRVAETFAETKPVLWQGAPSDRVELAPYGFAVFKY